MSADDIWNDLFGGFDSLNRRIEDMFRQMDVSGPDVRTYGYTMWQGPDGVRHVKEFGNSGSQAIGPAGPRDPFTDVSDDGDVVRAIVEVPGVEKQDISLSCTRSVLSVKVSTPGRELEKDIALPCEVDVDSARAEYNNGILEVTMDKASPSSEGRRIEIQRGD